MAIREENKSLQNNILIASLFSVVILLIGIGFGFSYSVSQTSEINIIGNDHILKYIITLIPTIGKVVGGARRWINIQFIQFQPSELAKISVLIYASAVLSNKRFL